MTIQDVANWPLRALARPRLLAIACIGGLVAAAWAYLGLMLAGTSGAGFLEALCRPAFGTASSRAASAPLTLAVPKAGRQRASRKPAPDVPASISPR